MLKRKIEQQLIEWKNDFNHNPLIIKGPRQVEKPSLFSILLIKTITALSI